MHTEIQGKKHNTADQLAHINEMKVGCGFH